MAQTTAQKWSKELTEHSEWRKGDPYRWVISTASFCIDRARAEVPEKEKSLLEKTKDTLRTLSQRPSSGRTTALGRRVEKPGSVSPAGPSGQKDRSKHDGRHTNK